MQDRVLAQDIETMFNMSILSSLKTNKWLTGLRAWQIREWPP